MGSDAECLPLLHDVYPRLSHGAWIPSDISTALEVVPLKFMGYEAIR
jgi:hypothetical protein